MIKNLHLTFLLIFCGKLSYSQNVFSNTKSYIETGFYASSSSKQLPFWLYTNQYSAVSLSSPSVTVRGFISKDYDSTFHSSNQKLKKFGIGYGFGGVTNLGKRSKFLIPEAFVKVRYQSLELYIGRRREIMGIVDSSLTSGSYIWSGNALPIPKIQISIPHFKQLGKSSVFIKFGLSHGWFGNQGSVRSYYLHQKWIYGRIGKDNAMFKLYGGINHQVQWGGITDNKEPLYSTDGKLAPYPFYSYQFVLIPFLQKLIKANPNKLTSYDSGLAIGNHLGSVDFGIEYESRNVKLLFYKQQPYDFARSLYNLNSIEDGLYGLSFKFKNKEKVSNLLFEYLHTVSQGLYRFGKYRSSNFIENDNYFSHGQYISWNYNGLIIGTPFILANDKEEIYNNRINAFSAFLSGRIQKNISYSTGGTFSSNLGIYGVSLNKNQFSGKVHTSYSLNSSASVSGHLAVDIGRLYPKNLGLSLIYKKIL